MFSPPFSRHDALETPLPAEDAARKVRERLSQLSKRTDDDEGLAGGARIGSRLALRFWGLWFPIGRKQLPLVTTWATEPVLSGSRVIIEMRSDAGWNFISARVLRSAYEQRFDQLAAELRKVLA